MQGINYLSTKQYCLVYFLLAFPLSDMENQERQVLLKALGQNIKRIRLEKGLTQKQLGAFVDLEYQQISRIERGGTNPNFLLLYEISKGLNTSLLHLMDIKM